MWKAITEKTLIPISAISIIVGATMWLTSVWKQGEANAAQIADIKGDNIRSSDKIYNELYRLNEKLDRILERIK